MLICTAHFKPKDHAAVDMSARPPVILSAFSPRSPGNHVSKISIKTWKYNVSQKFWSSKVQLSYQYELLSGPRQAQLHNQWKIITSLIGKAEAV